MVGTKDSGGGPVLPAKAGKVLTRLPQETQRAVVEKLSKAPKVAVADVEVVVREAEAAPPDAEHQTAVEAATRKAEEIKVRPKAPKRTTTLSATGKPGAMLTKSVDKAVAELLNIEKSLQRIERLVEDVKKGGAESPLTHQPTARVMELRTVAERVVELYRKIFSTDNLGAAE